MAKWRLSALIALSIFLVSCFNPFGDSPELLPAPEGLRLVASESRDLPIQADGSLKLVLDVPSIGVKSLSIDTIGVSGQVNLQIGNLVGIPSRLGPPPVVAIYQYIQIGHDGLDATQVGNVTVGFDVDMAWIDANGYTAREVALERYSGGLVGATHETSRHQHWRCANLRSHIPGPVPLCHHCRRAGPSFPPLGGDIAQGLAGCRRVGSRSLSNPHASTRTGSVTHANSVTRQPAHGYRVADSHPDRRATTRGGFITDGHVVTRAYPITHSHTVPDDPVSPHGHAITHSYPITLSHPVFYPQPGDHPNASAIRYTLSDSNLLAHAEGCSD